MGVLGLALTAALSRRRPSAALNRGGGTSSRYDLIPFSRRLAYPVGMTVSDKRKQSLYFPEEMLKEIGAEATRQDRSLSWIVQKAWKAARKDIMNIPSVDSFPREQDKDDAAK